MTSTRGARSFLRRHTQLLAGLKDGACNGLFRNQAKLQARGQPARDFLIEGPAEHGMPPREPVWHRISGLTPPGDGDHVRGCFALTPFFPSDTLLGAISEEARHEIPASLL